MIFADHARAGTSPVLVRPDRLEGNLPLQRKAREKRKKQGLKHE